MRNFLLTLVLIVTPTLTGCFGTIAYLRDPDPVYVHPGTPIESVRGAILSALDGRLWHLESEQPNAVIATLYKGRHRARVVIRYDQNGVYIQYVDSVELRYSVDARGTQRIHRNYNSWTSRLARTIERGLPVGGSVPVIVFQ